MLGGEADLAFLDALVVEGAGGFVGVVRRRVAGQGVGHAQVGAQHVDHGLTLVGVVLGEAFQGVEPGQADRCLVRAELFGGLGVELGDPAVGGVLLRGLGDPLGVRPVDLGDLFGVDLDAFALGQLQFLGALAAGREVQGEQAAAAHRDARGGLDRVHLRGGLPVRVGQGQAVDPPPQHQQRQPGRGQHHHGDHRHRPPRQRRPGRTGGRVG
nr:hypothetical protein GCM10017745_46000 [Saccharothrix mutabilis subsp. capreolus]